MLEPAKAGPGVRPATGRSSPGRVFRLAAGWWRCGRGFPAISLGETSAGPGKSMRRVGAPRYAGLFIGCSDATGHPELAKGPWERSPAKHAEGHLAMTPTIPYDIVEVYALGPSKAFLTMAGAKTDRGRHV